MLHHIILQGTTTRSGWNFSTYRIFHISSSNSPWRIFVEYSGCCLPKKQDSKFRFFLLPNVFKNMLPKGFLKNLYIAQAGTGGGDITDVTECWREVIIPFFTCVLWMIFNQKPFYFIEKKIYLEMTSQVLIKKKKNLYPYILLNIQLEPNTRRIITKCLLQKNILEKKNIFVVICTWCHMSRRCHRILIGFKL